MTPRHPYDRCHSGDSRSRKFAFVPSKAESGGYSPGWCKPKSPGEDSEGRLLATGTIPCSCLGKGHHRDRKSGETRLRLQRHPQDRMVNREKRGFSTFSSCQNNNKRRILPSAGKTFCPGKGRSCPSHLADPWEEEMRSKTNPFSGICTQEPKVFTARHGATHGLVYPQRLAHSRPSHNSRKLS